MTSRTDLWKIFEFCSRNIICFWLYYYIFIRR